MSDPVDVPALGRRAHIDRSDARNLHLRRWLRDHGREMPATLETWRGLAGHLQATLPEAELLLYLSRALRPGQTLDDTGVKYVSAYCLARSFRDFSKKVAPEVVGFVLLPDGSTRPLPEACEDKGRDSDTTLREHDTMTTDQLTPVRLYTSQEEADAKFELLKTELAKPTSQRTREAAARQWPTGAHCYRTYLKWQKSPNKAPAQPPEYYSVDLWASDERQAIDRYKQLFGINSYDTCITFHADLLEEIDSDLPA